MGFSTAGGIPNVVSVRNFGSNTNLLLQGRGIGGFTEPSALFGNGEQGAWWDFSDLNSMRTTGSTTQSNTTSPALEGTVGFVADKRLPISGTNQIRNSNLSQGNAFWQVGANTTIEDYKFVSRATGAFATIFAQNNSRLLANTWYYWTMDCVTVSGSAALQYSGGINIAVGNLGTGQISGWFNTGATANGNLTMIEGSGATFTGSFANLSFYEAPGNHLVQPTVGARPLLSRRYNGIISKNLNPIFATNGSTTSGTGFLQVIPTAVNAIHQVQGTSTAYWAGGVYPASTSMTASVDIYPSPGGNQWVFVSLYDGTDHSAYFSLALGTVGTLAGGATLTSRAIYDPVYGNGYRLTIVGTTQAVPTNALLVIAGANGDGSRVYVGDGVTPDFVISKPDVRLSIDAALAIPGYQEVTSAAVYDTLGFPAYLLFDGATKWMQSANSIPFTSSQATVVIGESAFTNTGGVVVTSLSGGNPGYFDVKRGGQYNTIIAGTAGQSRVGAQVIAPPETKVIGLVLDQTKIGANNQITQYFDSIVDNFSVISDTNVAGPFQTNPVAVGAANTGLGQFFSGRMFGVIIKDGAANANDFSMTNKWMGSKCGKFF